MWLGKAGYAELVPKFESNAIDGMTLLTLGAPHLVAAPRRGGGVAAHRGGNSARLELTRAVLVSRVADGRAERRARS